MIRLLTICTSAIVAFGLKSCIDNTAQDVQVSEVANTKLSDYHFFIGNLADLNPNEGVLPYDLNSPLFSDYAQKARFLWIPEGVSVQYSKDDVLDFPEGTVLIKNFFYSLDENKPNQGKRILETRLLIHRAEEWEAIGYIWNKEQTEAYLQVVGDIQEVEWQDKRGELQSLNYIIPNKNQCKSCHSTEGQLKPIGPTVQNLNKDYSYPEGSSNQLAKWSSMGYLNGYSEDVDHPKLAAYELPESGSLQERALAYLDINCGHCHNPKGAANTSGLTLKAQSNLDTSLGIFKPTVSAGAGTGGHTYSIVPGKPEESIMVYRMNSTDPGSMMPELGRQMVHKEGVALITAWIQELEPLEELDN